MTYEMSFFFSMQLLLRCQLAAAEAAEALHLQSLFNISASTLAYLLCFPPPRGAQQQEERKAADTPPSPLPSAAAQVALDAIMQTRPQLRWRPHVLAAAAAVVVVVLALMPCVYFFSTVCAGLPLCGLPSPSTLPLPLPSFACLSAYIG